MDKDYHIAYVDKPAESAWGIIGRGVDSYNKQKVDDDKPQRLCFALYGPDQEIVGGVIGAIYWDWFQMDLLWVKEELRGRGYGHRLLTLVEDKARECGAKHVHLDTFSFQSPDFYKKHGYRVFGELVDFPRGHQRYYLAKQL